MNTRNSILGLVIVAFASAACAGEVPRREIAVQGQAARLVTPDQAELRIVVEGRAQQSGEAMELAGANATRVIDAIAKFADRKQLRALQTSVRQVVRGTRRGWRQNSGEPVEMLAERTIEAERLDIDKLPEIMAALSRLSLARVDQVRPTVSNAREVEDEVLLEAVDDAKARAARIAGRLGVKLGLPISVHTQLANAPPPRPMARAMVMESADAGGGYDTAGENEIRASVSISFEIEAR